MTKEYDFLNWTSFPSSLKLTNDGSVKYVNPGLLFNNLATRPGVPLRLELAGKQQNVTAPLGGYSHFPIWGAPQGGEYRYLGSLAMPLGTYDWQPLSRELPIPADIVMINATLGGASGTPENPGITWFDDLKIHQDDVLIYANDFSNWAPVIIPAQIITGVAMIKYLK